MAHTSPTTAVTSNSSSTATPSPPPQQTYYLARLVGPTLVALGLTEELNAHVFADSTPAVVYLNGTALLVAGLALCVRERPLPRMVGRNHREESPSLWWCEWLISLTGAAALALGASRMVFPEAMFAASKRLAAGEQGGGGKGAGMGIVCGVMVVAGAVLSCVGFAGW